MIFSKKRDSFTIDWYSLDNTACIFPSLVSKRNTTVFRMSIVLKERIKVKYLNAALQNIVERFPYFDVTKRTGLFWYYFEANSLAPELEADLGYPCQPGFLQKKGGHPFRICCFKNTVSMEASHAVTDGTGALFFLKALVCEYFHLQGIEINDYQDIYHPKQVPDTREFEDSYQVHYQKKIGHPPKEESAYHFPAQFSDVGVYHVLNGILDTKEALAKAKSYGATLTEFLAAVYLLSLQTIWLKDNRKNKKNWIRVVIPVNLRKLYASITSRNFVLYVAPGIDMRLGEYSFEELVQMVHYFMKMNINQKALNKQISKNVGMQSNLFIRLAPVFLKNMIIPYFYNKMGEDKFSGCVTNVGTISFPPEIESRIESLGFVPNPSVAYFTVCGVIGFQDKLYLSFGRNIDDPVLERLFFENLIRLGLKVKIREFKPGMEVF